MLSMSFDIQDNLLANISMSYKEYCIFEKGNWQFGDEQSDSLLKKNLEKIFRNRQLRKIFSRFFIARPTVSFLEVAKSGR